MMAEEVSRGKGRSLYIILLLVFLVGAPVSAAEKITGTITSLEGPALVESGKIAKAAALRMALFSGDVLKTSKGTVEITFAGGNRLRLQPHSVLSFHNPPKSSIQQIQLHSGRLWYKAGMEENTRMVLVTKNASVNLGFSEGESEFRPQQDTCIVKLSLGRVVVSALCGNKEVKELFGGQEISLVGCQFSALRGGGAAGPREGGGSSGLSSSTGGTNRTGMSAAGDTGGGGGVRSSSAGGGLSLAPSAPSPFPVRPPASPYKP